MKYEFAAHQADDNSAVVLGDYTDCRYLCEFNPPECITYFPQHGNQETIRMNNLYWNL